MTKYLTQRMRVCVQCTALDLDFIITFLSSINFSWPGQFSVYKLYVLSLLSHFTIEQIDTWLSFGLFIL